MGVRRALDVFPKFCIPASTTEAVDCPDVSMAGASASEGLSKKILKG